MCKEIALPFYQRTGDSDARCRDGYLRHPAKQFGEEAVAGNGLRHLILDQGKAVQVAQAGNDSANHDGIVSPLAPDADRRVGEGCAGIARLCQGDDAHDSDRREDVDQGGDDGTRHGRSGNRLVGLLDIIRRDGSRLDAQEGHRVRAAAPVMTASGGCPLALKG